jgi:hypothetical protein
MSKPKRRYECTRTPHRQERSGVKEPTQRGGEKAEDYWTRKNGQEGPLCGSTLAALEERLKRL